MKRTDIQPWNVYGYNPQREHIYRYSPVMVLSTDSYFRSRFGEKLVEPCEDKTERLCSPESFKSTVGLLAVLMNADRTDHDSVRKLRALATVERAVEALNESGAGVREIRDTDDPAVILGTYMLVTDARYLHGYYDVLVRDLARAEQRDRDIAQQQEESRLADLSTYQSIVGRFADLGIMLARAAEYDHPSMVKMTFEQAEQLISLAQDGALMRSKA